MRTKFDFSEFVSPSKEGIKLAKYGLNNKLLSDFIEARILRDGREKLVLYFFFKNNSSVRLFYKKKEQIKEKLRIAYKRQLGFYKSLKLVFCDIEAKNYKEARHRSLKEQETLEKGIFRLECLVKTFKKVA